jgi:PASTA domain
MDFREAVRRYADLKRRYDNNDLSAEEFLAQHKQIMVRDADGRWWAPHRDTGVWQRYDDEHDTWVRDTPPQLVEDSSGHPVPGGGGRRLLPWIVGFAGMLVLIGVAVWFLVPGGGVDDDTVSVPSITGKTLAEARQTVGHRFEIVGYESGANPDDVVLSQDPRSGEQAERGSEISITLGSSDERFVKVPDVTGMSETEARETLEDNGLTLGNVEEESSDSVPTGHVIRQSPLPGSMEQPYSAVNVTISKGS